MTVASSVGVTFERTVPALVVGAGAAGLTAALAARESGADCLVLERDATPTGATALSAGLVPAAGTRWQRAAGIADGPELYAADIRAQADNEPDPSAVDVCARMIGPTLEWLADRHGFDFEVLTDFRYPGHSACRMHALPGRSGPDLIARLADAARAAGVAIETNCEATTLFADPDDRVRGALVRRGDGSEARIGCGALILACSGYGADPGLRARHLTDLAEALYLGHPGARGDALRWGQALGAATRHLSGHQGHGSVTYPQGIPITWACVAEGAVQVSMAGRRFADESHGYSAGAADVLRQPGGVAWTVFDGRIAEIGRRFADFRRAEAAGLMLTADDWTALAALMEVPAPALEETMAATEAWRRGLGRDPLGRDFAGLQPFAPPFHAVRITAGLYRTQGGLVVDGRARVLRRDGRPLPNLLAAGGAACGVSGAQARGYLAGNGLLVAFAYGALAGRTAARARR